MKLHYKVNPMRSKFHARGISEYLINQFATSGSTNPFTCKKETWLLTGSIESSEYVMQKLSNQLESSSLC